MHFNASLSANARLHKYSVIFKGKKLPNYLNICQTHAHLTIQEQVSASSVCCKLDPLSDPDISCYPQMTTAPPCLSHCEQSRNRNKAPDNSVLRAPTSMTGLTPEIPLDFGTSCFLFQIQALLDGLGSKPPKTEVLTNT